MAIKNWFGGGAKGAKQDPAAGGKEPEYSIDDLIVLERYDEAAERLKAKLKLSPQDLHTHLKLAEVYAQLREFGRAVDEFGFVAEEYAQDGFYDKGVALLSKAQKLAPMDSSIRFKIERIQREKSMEHVRAFALEGLRQAGGQKGGTSALEQLKRLWHHLATSGPVQRLPGDQLKRLFSAMQLLHLETDAVVAEEGSKEPFLLLIVLGVIDGWIGDQGRAMNLRSFSSGDIIGESALFERGAWPANYKASEPTTVLRLSREGLEQALLGNSDPRGFLEVLREQHHDRDLAVNVRKVRSGG